MAGNYDAAEVKDILSLIGSPDKTLNLIRSIFTSAKDIIEEYFDAEFLKAPLARMAGELSTAPAQKTSAISSIMMAMRHHPGVSRPKGSTGALTQALVAAVKNLGSDILTDEHVEKVLVDGDAQLEFGLQVIRNFVPIKA